MLLLITALLLVSPALASYQQEEEPEDMHFDRYSEIRRRVSYHLTCPVRAVCATAYDFNRTIRGVDYPERRVIYNCQCAGNGDCPIRPENRIYTSTVKREYLCQPIESMMRCNNPGRRIRKMEERFAQNLVFGAEVFDYIPFTRINCICPRHITPAQRAHRFDMALATSHSRYRLLGGVSYELRNCL